MTPQHRANLHTAADAVRIGLWDWQVGSEHVVYSTEWKRQLGYEEHEISDSFQEWSSRMHPEDMRIAEQRIKDYLEGRTTEYAMEFRMRHKDGKWRWILTYASMLRFEEGRPTRMIGCHIDITRHKQAESGLQRINRALRMVGDCNLALARLEEEQALLREVCRLVVEVGGYRRAWIWCTEEGGEAGLCLAAQAGAPGPPELDLALEAMEKAERVVAEDAPFATTMDSVYAKATVALPLCRDGRTIGVLELQTVEGETFEAGELEVLADLAVELAFGVAVLRTRKERDQAVRELQVSQRKLEQAQRIAHIGHWERNLETGSIMWSGEMHRIFGIPEKFGISLPQIAELLHEEDREHWRQVYVDAIRGKRSYELEYRIIRPDGELRYIYSRGEVSRNAVGWAVRVFGTAQDVTERKRTEQAQRESEQRFRQMTETIDEVFWLTDVENYRVIYVSPAFARVWGRPCETLYEYASTWAEAIHPEDRDATVQAMLTQQVLGKYDVNYRIVRPDGAVRWIHDRAFPIQDAEGKVYRMAGVAKDITAQREMEEQLRQSQKMEAVGLLAGGIAHDFNNLLAVIQLQTSLLLTTRELAPRLRKGMEEIMEASERAANLTRQLLTFSRREQKHAKDLNLAEIVDTTIKLLRRILGEEIALETRYSAALPPVHADPGMMEQVLMNLAINARDAMPRGGRLTVTLERIVADEKRVAAHPGVEAGAFVCLSVSDTGMGIAPAHLARIFEPFFTTKEKGEGTGLGLATVFGIVEQHGGWVEVASALGAGTTFRVYLPALEGAASASTEEIQPPPVRGGNECILLVEDDEILLGVARQTLEHVGYRVLAVPDATEALQVWRRESRDVSLLLTDLIMPGGMTGQELADRLVLEKPTVKVICTSGHSEQVVAQRLREDCGGSFLRKPYTARTLVEAVRSSLDRG